jgi:hypothetical protein
MYSIAANKFSITFHNQVSSDISHDLMYDHEDTFLNLMNAGFKTIRDGFNISLFLTTETELYKVRHITQTPLFIKF